MREFMHGFRHAWTRAIHSPCPGLMADNCATIVPTMDRYQVLFASFPHTVLAECSEIRENSRFGPPHLTGPSDNPFQVLQPPGACAVVADVEQEWICKQ